MATLNAQGVPTIIMPTGPFGEQRPNANDPTNGAPGTANGYLGTFHKATETSLLTRAIQMGARVYIPELGRFLQVDPVEGGTANNYVYVTDPVNERDLDGKWIWIAIPVVVAIVRAVIPKLVKFTVKQTPKQVVKQAPRQTTKYTPRVTTKVVPRSQPRSYALATPKQTVGQSRAVGNRQSPLINNRSNLKSLGNKPTIINSKNYSGHAIDGMQSSGIYPSVVENTIRYGKGASQVGGTTRYYDMYNNVSVVTDSIEGRVITVFTEGR